MRLLALIPSLLICFRSISCNASDPNRFPDDFRFGIATAAYQIEGAWNISGKGENVWDHFTHHQPHKIKDRSNGDVACDSYHNYKRDVEMLKELGVDFYRFSISWARILPKGYGGEVNQAGIDYYNNLIDEMLKNNIQPLVTLFHWDTPQALQEMGGWTNPLIVDYFENYARVVFENFGDRVRDWVTFNEPYNMCLFGYGSRTGLTFFAPDLNIHGVAEYECTHNVIKAHARAYHLYDDHFRAKQKGKLSMASLILWAEPETDTAEAMEVVEKTLQFNMGWFCHPIFTKEGDYPLVMRQQIAAKSAQQGYSKSRLPEFTKEEIDYIRGTYDYMGINYYTAVVYKQDEKLTTREVPSHENDLGYVFYQKDSWKTGASPWLKLRPDGLRDAINWVAREYDNPEIYITENGYSSRGGLNDVDRVEFFNDHLAAVLKAIDDGANVTAYTAWSLMDNFEWVAGYTELFGVYQVDFKSPLRTRIPRMSALTYANTIRSRRIDRSYLPYMPEEKASSSSSDDEVSGEDLQTVNTTAVKIVLIVAFVTIAIVFVALALNAIRKKERFQMWMLKMRSDCGEANMKAELNNH